MDIYLEGTSKFIRDMLQLCLDLLQLCLNLGVNFIALGTSTLQLGLQPLYFLGKRIPLRGNGLQLYLILLYLSICSLKRQFERRRSAAVVGVEGSERSRVGSFERFELSGMGVLELRVGSCKFCADGSKFLVVFFASGSLKDTSVI